MPRGRKNDAVYQGYYAPHLEGTEFAGNTAVTRQAIIERMYMRILTELAVNRFKWEGLPDSVDPRFLEVTLFRYALSIFYFDDMYNAHFALQGAANGQLNMMNNPTAFRVTGNGSFVGKTLSAFPTVAKVGDEYVTTPAQCVPIWANYLRVPDLDVVTIYAGKLAGLDRSIEINSDNARRTKVITSTENQKLSNVNLNRQISEGQPVVHIKPGLDLQSNIQAFDMGVDPDTIINLHILKVRLWGECMGLLGINNANQDKKERLVASEVTANDAQVSAMRAVNLNERQKAADIINKRYGLEIKVSYHVDEVAGSTVPGDPNAYGGDSTASDTEQPGADE